MVGLQQYRYLRNFLLGKRKDFGKYSVVRPGTVTPGRLVPPHVPRPSYHHTGLPTESIDAPELKNGHQIADMRKSCKLAANILKTVRENIRVGMTTDDIDDIVHRLTIENGAYPSPLNYKHFPKSVCTSVNNVACHGIPDDRKLENGDLINVDITVFLEGFHGDCSQTFLVGDVDEKGRKLVEATELCRDAAIKLCKPGTEFSQIGCLIQTTAARLGFNVVPAFLGHGIGHYFHGPPDIFHFANNYPGRMAAGMTFTIEPILTQGGEDIVILEDNWTAIMYDDARSAQFEHTVLVTDNGVEILTLPD